MQIFAVYDKVSKTYGHLQAHASSALAIREFTIATRNPQTMLHEFPDEYELHLIGEFDEESENPVEGKEPVALITGRAVKNMDDIQEKNQELAAQ